MNFLLGGFVFTSESISRSSVSIHQASSTTGTSTRHTTTVVIGLTATWKSSVLLRRLLVVTSHLMGLVLRTMISANHYNRKKRQPVKIPTGYSALLGMATSGFHSMCPSMFFLLFCSEEEKQIHMVVPDWLGIDTQV